ncbi:MAG: FecR family protein [Phycisphaeraceae bacterium]|nr:FecR family protein [Phycisphaeraceae bacterium]
MSELTPNQRECAALITALIEAELFAEQRDRLNELCRQDQDCRKLYAAVMSVHGMLLWSSHLSAEQEKEQQDESDAFLLEIYEQARLNRIKLDAEVELAKNLKAQADQEKKRRPKHGALVDETRSHTLIIPKAVVYGGLAAAILLAFVLLWPVIQGAGPASNTPGVPEVAEAGPEAELIRSQDAVWGQAVPADGVLAGAKAWSLERGFAEIAMPSGASVILHGPTTFRILEPNKLALDDGRLTAEVPDRAKYFTVKTRSMDVVDLGTRFGVTVEPDGVSSASVFEGKVEVNEPTARGTGAPRVVALTAGQQVRADASGKLAESITAIQPDHGYVSRWDAIQRRVVVQGQGRFFNTPPNSVRQGELGNTNRIIIFEESTAVLDQPLSVMTNLPERRAAKFATVPAGRKVVSYFLHSEPDAADDSSYATATLTFPGRVLGVVGTVKQLRETNALFGLDTVGYTPDDQFITYGIDPGSPDHFAIGGLQGNVLTIHLAAGRFADQARVIVELPDTSGDQ